MERKYLFDGIEKSFTLEQCQRHLETTKEIRSAVIKEYGWLKPEAKEYFDHVISAYEEQIARLMA